MSEDYSAEIARIEGNIQEQRNLINQCSMQIDQKNKDIAELTEMHKHYSELDTVLQDSSGGALSLIQGLSECVLSGMILNMTFFSSLIDAVKGDGYRTAKRSVENARGKISAQINKIQEEIVGLNAQIVSGKAAITRMNMNKAAYEQKQNES